MQTYQFQPPQVTISPASQAVWQTTFDHATFPDQRTAQKGPGHHWEVSDYYYDYPGPNNLPCVNGNCGIGPFGNWYTSLGGPNKPTGDDVIHTNANNPSGGGGKGFRHWRGNGGNGQNNNGGGITISLPVSLGEFWFRMYMRYQLGFTFGPDGIADPGYTKEMRNESSGGWIFGIQGGHSWGIFDTVAGNITSNKSWQSTMNGMVGDGIFHCYEFHWKNGPNSRIEMWVDNAQVLDTVRNTSPDLTRNLVLGSNQNAVGDANGKSVNSGGVPTDWYTDYDDIAFSTAGRIGTL